MAQAKQEAQSLTRFILSLKGKKKSKRLEECQVSPGLGPERSLAMGALKEKS